MPKQEAPKPEAPKIVGFVPAGRWRWVEWDEKEHGGDERYAGMEPAEGSESFRCEILVSLTGRQFTELMAKKLNWDDLTRMLAPCVRAWNATGLEEDPETGERRGAVLPAPYYAGPGVFDLLLREQVLWIWDRVKFSGIENPDLPNSGTPATKQADGQDGTSSPEDGSSET